MTDRNDPSTPKTSPTASTVSNTCDDLSPRGADGRSRQAASDAVGDRGLCEECDGRGKILDAPDRVLDGRAYWTTCPECLGTGYASKS